MKFLCLTMCQGEVCTDDVNADTDTDANNDGQSMIGTFGLSTKALYNHALSIVVIGIILHWHWHRRHLCTPPPGTWLDIETSYLVHICTYVPHICTSNI